VVVKYLLYLVLILLPVPALGCVCDTSVTVQTAFRESAAIFSGRLIAAEYRKGIKNEFAEMDAEWRGKKREYEVLVYRFEVTRWYKSDGNASREVVLVTDNVRFLDDGTESISDCGLGFEKDVDYLIYAYGDEKEISTNACSLTKRLARARADIAILEKLRKR
jgi:hypothetical protein